MSNDPDDKFFDVLAGRRTADDADTRRAARLRQYFEMHPSLEEQPRNDPQGEAQMIAFLRARAAAAGPVAAQSPEKPGLLKQLGNWLFPAEGGRGMRYGMAAAALLGALVVVRVFDPGADDITTLKGLPPATTPAEVVRSADPAKAAAEVQAVLTANGVAATVTPQGREVLLKAEVPADKRAAVAQALTAQGLAVPAHGKLSLRFAPLS